METRKAKSAMTSKAVGHSNSKPEDPQKSSNRHLKKKEEESDEDESSSEEEEEKRKLSVADTNAESLFDDSNQQ